MMTNNLLCPMQIRMNDVVLNDTPNLLTENPTNKTHAISGCDQDGREHIIPFTLRGVTSYIPTRKPSIEEFETCPRIELTYESPEWDPIRRPSDTRKRPSWTIKDLSEMHLCHFRGDRDAGSSRPWIHQKIQHCFQKRMIRCTTWAWCLQKMSTSQASVQQQTNGRN